MHLKSQKLEGFAILLFLLVFLFVPYIRLGGSTVFLGIFTFLIPTLIVMVCRPWLLKPWSRAIIALVAILFLIVVSYSLNLIANDSIYRGIDLKGLKIGVANIFIFVSCIWLYYAVLRTWTADRIVYFLYLAILINALLSLAIFLSLDLEKIFYSIIGVNDAYFEYPFRRPPGLMYDGFSYLSSLLGLAFVLGAVLFFETERFSGLLGFVKFLVMQVVLLMAITINGRSGLVVCLLGLVVYFCVIRATKGMVSMKGAMRFAMLLLVMTGIGSAVYLALVDSEYGWYFQWAFSFITDFFSGNEISDSSVVEIGENHMFLPNSVFDVFLGRNDFNADATVDTYHSDVGYVQMIHGFGSITLGFLVMICLYLIVACFRICKREPLLGTINIVFIVEFLMLNFKDFYFVSPYPHFIAFYLLLIALFDRAAAFRMLPGSGNN